MIGFLCSLLLIGCCYVVRPDIFVTSRELKGHVQGLRDLNHYPLCRPLFAIGLDACFYMDKLK
jgi:hypothetical protein